MKSPYPRISVNSACNLNCFYCHNDGNCSTGKDIHMGDVLLVAKMSKEMGIEKIKLTGGEPLLRDDLPAMISKIKKIHPSVDLSLITNGVKLAEMAEELRDSGLDRVTVSLPSLDIQTYEEITGSQELSEVRRGLGKAKDIGLEPVKLNVVLNDQNLSELDLFVGFANKKGYQLRFLEMIPFNEKAEESKVSEKEIHERLMKIFDEYEEVTEDGTDLLLYRSGEKEARVKKKVEDPGEGNYLRLTADSCLKPNLNDEGSIKLRKGGIPENNFHTAFNKTMW